MNKVSFAGIEIESDQVEFNEIMDAVLFLLTFKADSNKERSYIG